MDHNIRAGIAQQAADGVGLHEVVVGAAGHEEENLCHELHELARIVLFFVKIRQIRGGQKGLCHELHELARIVFFVKIREIRGGQDASPLLKKGGEAEQVAGG